MHGPSDIFDPSVQSVPAGGRSVGPEAGAGGAVAAAVGAACSVLQRAKHPQPEADGVGLPELLPSEVNPLFGSGAQTTQRGLHGIFTGLTIVGPRACSVTTERLFT